MPMVRLTPLKYSIFFAGVIILIIIAVPFAGGEIISQEKDRPLRIVYGGHLMGNIEPCG